MPEGDRALLIEDLVSGYGKKQVLNSISLTVAEGEIVALIGHNGSGKSTLLKSAFGLLPIWKGEVLFWGKKVRMSPRELLQAGVVYVPQGNCVFTELTVRDNLELGSIVLQDRKVFKDGIDRVLTMFPPLEERLNRRAATLSGGEKQMLALANALVLSPRLILLDEPSLGLAPSLVGEAFDRVEQSCRNLGAAALIVEQKVRAVLKIAQRVYVLRGGRVAFTGPANELRTDETRLRDTYL